MRIFILESENYFQKLLPERISLGQQIPEVLVTSCIPSAASLGHQQAGRVLLINPSLFVFQLATVQPGQNFHMFTKEELEEVIKDI